jgi:hypothetical protein
MGFQFAITAPYATLRLPIIDSLLSFLHYSLLLNRSYQSTCCFTHRQILAFSSWINSHSTVDSPSIIPKGSNW